ncbi:hypothetical protein [Ammoniphilus sp. 3BR4]|uniref:DUF7674 family protein n=1 Tax=Ammoniphilus sp. 3BR4 TaxID=3158265 RepID=UPI00346607C5
MMNLTYNNIVQEMLKIIPQLQPLYDKELEKLWQVEGLIPPHIAFGDIFNPFLISLLQKPQELTKDDEKLLSKIFNFLENMALSEDVKIQEVVSVTVMARIGDDLSILKNALKYMGNETKKLSKEIEEYYGRKIM